MERETTSDCKEQGAWERSVGAVPLCLPQAGSEKPRAKREVQDLVEATGGRPGLYSLRFFALCPTGRAPRGRERGRSRRAGADRVAGDPVLPSRHARLGLHWLERRTRPRSRCKQ